MLCQDLGKMPLTDRSNEISLNRLYLIDNGCF